MQHQSKKFIQPFKSVVWSFSVRKLLFSKSKITIWLFSNSLISQWPTGCSSMSSHQLLLVRPWKALTVDA
uniref:Uncharacterized protein n=1 Tax=Kalanchoe fedtschenkoi TaxID=63787 RepID=A0A7N0SWP6_KALFE